MEPHRTADAEERSRIVEHLTAELSAVPGLAFAYLYGSFAHAEAFRDVDIGVFLPEPGAALAGPSAVALAERLSARGGLPVDVRILNDAPVSFLYHVLRGQLLLSRDEDLLAGVIERTARTYLDLAPLLRRSTKEAFAA